MHDDPVEGSPLPVTTQPVDPGATAAIDGTRPAAAGEDRSPNVWVCPFLRALDDDDALGPPIESPDPANRCAAMHEPVPQSLRQQELVCLSSGHVNCPRYLRGSLGAPEPVERVRVPRAVTRATAGALVVFALAFAVSLAFVIANGGLVLSAAAPTSSPAGSVLGDVATPPSTAAPVATAAPSPTPLPAASPSPTPSPTPTPTATATSSPTPTPTATPTATPTSSAAPTSSRLALLKPCPDASNCYIYVVRRGDNLSSIANYFGVSLSKVLAMNPWTKNGLAIGHDLRIPTPTR